MAAYYFVAAALPPLSIGVRPDLSFSEVKELLALNLTPADSKKVAQWLEWIDLYNVRALWLGAPLDERGGMTSQELEEALLLKAPPLSPYLIEFLERYEEKEERLRFFSSLYVSFFRNAEKLRGFLFDYFRLEREIRLVLTALRAKQTGRDLLHELQFEDPFEPFIASILAQKEAPEYTPPREYEDLKALFVKNRPQPQKLHRALTEYRFKKVEELEESPLFNINHILSYLVRLLLAEDWARLDWEKGRVAVQELSRYG